MRKFTAAIAAGLFGALFFAVPANATKERQMVCPTWQLRSIVQEWTEPAEGSGVVNGSMVVLTKPEGGGTEFATFNLGLEFDEPTTIKVNYALSGGASPAAGAVRLFYYENPNANTLNDTPTEFVAADDTSGMLVIDDVTKVGTLGMVYDASNSAGGAATFTNLRVGALKVKFLPVCPSPSPSPSTTASPTPTATPTSEVTPGATTPAPSRSPVLSGGPSLPVTGAPVYLLAVAGGLLVAAGVAGMVLSRRRRQRFES